MNDREPPQLKDPAHEFAGQLVGSIKPLAQLLDFRHFMATRRIVLNTDDPHVLLDPEFRARHSLMTPLAFAVMGFVLTNLFVQLAIAASGRFVQPAGTSADAVTQGRLFVSELADIRRDVLAAQARPADEPPWKDRYTDWMGKHRLYDEQLKEMLTGLESQDAGVAAARLQGAIDHLNAQLRLLQNPFWFDIQWTAFVYPILFILSARLFWILSRFGTSRLVTESIYLYVTTAYGFWPALAFSCANAIARIYLDVPVLFFGGMALLVAAGFFGLRSQAASVGELHQRISKYGAVPGGALFESTVTYSDIRIAARNASLLAAIIVLGASLAVQVAIAAAVRRGIL